jgi:gamma-glutamylcyclotransferase (GGCT)/AIG2-like uncharacterized protein YtfP
MGGRHRSEPAKSRYDAFSVVVAQPEQTPSLLKVFVYGTLKPGQASYQAYCLDKVIDARAAIARGQLFSLPAGYPAMTLGEGQVHGFVLLFKDHATLSQLDDYEDYQVGRSPQHNLYERRLIETFAPTGQFSYGDTPRFAAGGRHERRSFSTGKSLGSAWAYLMSLEKVHHLKGTLLPEGQWN